MKISTVLMMLAVAVCSCVSAVGATFTVINTDDSGTGSLREAITNANGNGAGQDTILFDIPGAGTHTITVLSDLPSITSSLIIDGGNSGVASDRVEITGTLGTGLNFSGASVNEIRNLVINGFTGRQIQFVFG